MKRKIFALIALIIMICSTFSNSFALNLIHEKAVTERLSSGAYLTTYTRFTDKGWLDINVIEVDLMDNNTKIGLLNSENGLNTFQTVYQMANKDNIIAAINGDFFNGNSKNGNTIGLSISDGEVLTSTYYENELKDTFGTFVLDEKNNAWFDYFTNVITLKSKRNYSELKISEYNKLSSNYEYPVVYTKEWGEKSIGSTPDLILTELVVKNNKVKEVRYNKEPVEIPEDGFVISTLGEAAEYIQKNFTVGTRVELDIEMNLDIDSIKMAVSGGALLIENGKIPETFSSNISGTHPRTAIGLSEDGETLYLVTVDGRQKSSIGMTQKELAEFLLEKGVYNALNLDGGGSTTMVARKLGEENIKTINSPSGGVLRMVTNAIGVYNTERTSSLSDLILKVSEKNVFVGCEREIEVLGYDKYYNPVEVDLDDIQWSFEGANVRFDENKIIAGEEAGSVTIKASKGKATAEITIDILEKPEEIIITPENNLIALNENVKFSITAKDQNGYYASLKDNEVEFKVESGDGIFKDGKYLPKTIGEHIISASDGNAKSYVGIMVGLPTEELLNDFESENFYFTAYPSVIEGEVELTKKEKYDGEKSAKLEYDFRNIEATRAAYLRFDDEIEISEDATAIEFYVYSKDDCAEQVKMKLTDAKGATIYALVSKGFVGGEWTKMSYDLTSVALPATLTDIYIAQDDLNEENQGTIYFDNLTIKREKFEEENEITLPENEKGTDISNKETTLTSGDSLKIAIYDEIKKPQVLLEQLTKNKIEQKINQEAEVAIFTSQSDVNLLTNISSKKINCGKYSKTEIENSTFITLDISNSGIRTTEYEQWNKLQTDIKESTNQNIFIVLNGSLDDFSDEKEKQLFVDILSELKNILSKNIWVIYKGEKTVQSMEKGIKYICIGNEWVDSKEPLSVAQNTKYMLITVGKDEISYEVKKIYEK